MFLTELVLAAAPTPDYWFVRKPLAWKDPQFGTLTVPYGFRTDLASIPRALRNLPAFDPNGRSRRAAVMHDWLYAWRGIGKDNADAFLRLAMVVEGCPPAECDAFYAAVHWFGAHSWAQDAIGLANAFDPAEAYAAWLKGGGSMFAQSVPIT